MQGSPYSSSKPERTKKNDKGIDMFEATMKQKEVDYQLKIMENRLKKLQDEEDRVARKIKNTLDRTKQFEIMKEVKEAER
jgi:hypothetical protein